MAIRIGNLTEMKEEVAGQMENLTTLAESRDAALTDAFNQAAASKERAETADHLAAKTRGSPVLVSLLQPDRWISHRIRPTTNARSGKQCIERY